MAELIQSWSNKERALHYCKEAQKFHDLANEETEATVKRDLLELAAQYDRLVHKLLAPD